jgi:diacylglycerol kinase (ATP)
MMPHVYRGTHIANPKVEVVRTSSLRIESPSINAYADGEYLGPLPVEITLLPSAVNVLVRRQPT